MEPYDQVTYKKEKKKLYICPHAGDCKNKDPNISCAHKILHEHSLRCDDDHCTQTDKLAECIEYKEEKKGRKSIKKEKPKEKIDELVEKALEKRVLEIVDDVLKEREAIKRKIARKLGKLMDSCTIETNKRIQEAIEEKILNTIESINLTNLAATIRDGLDTVLQDYFKNQILPNIEKKLNQPINATEIYKTRKLG